METGHHLGSLFSYHNISLRNHYFWKALRHNINRQASCRNLSIYVGGDYRTRIWDLLRVNAGGKLFPIVYSAFYLFLLFSIYSITLFDHIYSECSTCICGQLCGQNAFHLRPVAFHTGLKWEAFFVSGWLYCTSELGERPSSFSEDEGSKICDAESKNRSFTKLRPSSLTNSSAEKNLLKKSSGNERYSLLLFIANAVVICYNYQ